MKKIILILSLLIYVAVIGFIEPTNVLTIDDVIAEVSFSELPRLYFEGSVNKLTTKKEEKKISVKYEGYDINFEGYAKIKLQGSSSLSYDKKNYTIKFYEDKNLEQKLKVDLGWGEQNEYCLKANWIDKTHARNIVTANIVADIQKKYALLTNTPNYGEIDGKPIEIYLNGEFLGLYTLNIPKDAWMFNMDEDNENHLVFSGDGWEETNFFKDEANFSDWEVEVGEESDEVLDKLNRLVKFVENSSDEDFKKNIDKYFNLDSLLNYYIMLEVAGLKDNVGKNMLLVTYDGEIWYTTLYDLDSSWGPDWQGKRLIDYGDRITPGGSRLWEKLEKNFHNELADRYFELRKDILTEEYIMSKFNKFASLIPTEVYEKEQDRWDDIPGYGLEQIGKFVKLRLPMLDEVFEDMYTRSPIIYDEDDDEQFHSLNLLNEKNLDN